MCLYVDDGHLGFSAVAKNAQQIATGSQRIWTQHSISIWNHSKNRLYLTKPGPPGSLSDYNNEPAN